MSTSIITSIIAQKDNRKLILSEAIRWGIDHEEIAIKEYSKAQPNVKIKKCGLVVSPQWPWLGCSPDSIVLEDGICVGCTDSSV